MKTLMVFRVLPSELGGGERKPKRLFERVAKDCSPLWHIPILITDKPADPALVSFGEMWADHAKVERTLEAARELVHPYVAGDVFCPNTSWH